jgi:hypothetical protein
MKNKISTCFLAAIVVLLGLAASASSQDIAPELAGIRHAQIGQQIWQQRPSEDIMAWTGDQVHWYQHNLYSSLKDSRGRELYFIRIVTTDCKPAKSSCHHVADGNAFELSSLASIWSGYDVEIDKSAVVLDADALEGYGRIEKAAASLIARVDQCAGSLQGAPSNYSVYAALRDCVNSVLAAPAPPAR